MNRLPRQIWYLVFPVVITGIAAAVLVNRQAEEPVESIPVPADLKPEGVRCEQVLAAWTRRDLAEVARHAGRVELRSCFPPAEQYSMAVALHADGYCTAAESLFTDLLKNDPGHRTAHLQLGLLKTSTGRWEAAREHWNYLLINGGLDLIAFPLVGHPELRLPDQDAALEKGAALRPADPFAVLGLARRALADLQYDECDRLLVTLSTVLPDSMDAALCRAELQHRRGDLDGIIQQLAGLDAAAQSRADYWVLYGHACRQLDSPRGAACCYWRAFQIDPTHYEATQDLGRSLAELGYKKLAERYVERAREIMNYRDVCRAIHTTHDIVERQLQSADRYAASLGCYRDAASWCQMAHQAFPEAQWPAVNMGFYQSKFAVAGRSARDDDLRDTIDLSGEKLPTLARRQSVTLAGSTDAQVKFESRAAMLGIHFTFEDGADPNQEETSLFEFTGGGVAAIDFDGDGWSDLFLTQGGPPPPHNAPWDAGSDSRPNDVLYRNQGAEHFFDVTSLTGLEDGYYGQGVSVGDFDSDGCPDLYVAGIGDNLLFRNNGDGTFARVHDEAFESAAAWTTSCLMVDLNNDGLPDLYDGNYVPLDFIHTQMCRSDGNSVPCDLSRRLEAAQDQLLVNNGDGTFANVTNEAGIVAPEGIALGIIACDFDANGALDLFVANDGRSNFLFMNQTVSPLRYSEEGLLRGVAYSGAGRAQACMGVAADDLDGDGLTDLFITNFFGDYNTVYRQLPGALFRDETNESGIRSVGYNMLGFGAQALDVDLDGDMDLVFTNGDVVDFSSVNAERPYRQTPLFLQNDGSGRFQPLPASQLGKFFQGLYLGRGLAVLDYNRDGRTDFAVSHIDSPAELVENTTTTIGHFLTLRLVGTTGSRDAVGAVVTVRAGGRSWVKHMLGGHGYMASNEQRLRFGLGATAAVDSIEVRWPAGLRETFQIDRVDCEYVLVEASGIPRRLPRPAFEE